MLWKLKLGTLAYYNPKLIESGSMDFIYFVTSSEKFK